MIYITSSNQLNELLGVEEVILWFYICLLYIYCLKIIVVGYFDFSTTNTVLPAGYLNYYLASLLALQIGLLI